MSVLDAVRWIEIPSVRDERGVLTAVEGTTDVPFDIKRIFMVHHVVTDRAGHAHRDTDQVVIAAAGRFRLELSDGSRTESYEMDDPTRGVYTPRMVFIRLVDFSTDAVCLVLASTPYDMSRSVRTWEEYLKLVDA